MFREIQEYVLNHPLSFALHRNVPPRGFFCSSFYAFFKCYVFLLDFRVKLYRLLCLENCPNLEPNRRRADSIFKRIITNFMFSEEKKEIPCYLTLLKIFYIKEKSCVLYSLFGLPKFTWNATIKPFR